MAEIRMMALTRDPSIRALTDATRPMAGCLHAEDFAGVEDSGELLHVELWESPTAWDAGWAARRDALSAVVRQAEFYNHARFVPTGTAWVAADDGVRADTIRWAASGAIRILILVAADPATPVDFFVESSVATRAEPGCGAFAYYRSLEFAENLALIESWSSPEIYDDHWQRRLAQNAPPPPTPPPRRYGETSFEWYRQQSYVLDGGIWVAADPQQRMATVLW